jgi:PKD domain
MRVAPGRRYSRAAEVRGVLLTSTLLFTALVSLAGANPGLVYAPASHSVLHPPGAPAAVLSASFSEGDSFHGNCSPLTVVVSLFGNASGGDPPYRFIWYFGVSTPLAFGQNTTHTYMAWGTFNVTLWVNDSAGTNASVTKAIFVPPPFGCPVPIGSVAPFNWFNVLLIVGVAVAVSAVGVWAVRRWRQRRRG